MDKEVSAQVIEYIEVTSKAQALAEKIASEREEGWRQVATIAPQIAAQLKQAGVIKAHEEKRAAELLQDPSQALKVFGNVLTKQAAERANAKTASVDRLGSPYGEERSTPLTGNTNPMYIGRRSVAGEKRASDLALEKLLDSRRAG
jgi:hypothetical protein